MLIEHIISQHAEEASFLWGLRDAAVKEPHYNHMDLKDLEERIDAHLDGLHIAGADVWQFCEAGLLHKDSGDVFAAAYTAAYNSKQDCLDQIFAVIDEAPECIRGLVSTLG
jgi:hypothetical protein